MKKFFSVFLCFVFFYGFMIFIHAEMSPAQRLAIIKALKIEGIVGENNKGLLEFKGPVKAKEVVDEENNIRLKAYKSLAEKNNVSVQEVGAQRAAQLASESPSGTWIQLPDGRWVRK